MPSPKPFSGPLRELILAFDVGTTFSGVGYAILDPGDTPQVQEVNKYPGQTNGNAKIPTMLWYTRDGSVRAAGAEALPSAMRLIAEDEDLVFVEWFKLHLRPRSSLKDDLRAANIPDLPARKSIVDVFADFLAYLYRCARKFITEKHPSGESLWASFGERINIVLSHPNGWEGAQQAQMRQAAVKAGLAPDTPAGHSHVHFVTEGEASVHYCVDKGLTSTFVKDGSSVTIVDAGGGTVDLSTYVFKTATPVSVAEAAPAGCILQGSTRVNIRAYEFIKAKLRNSRFGNEEDLRIMLEKFEESAKPTFKDPGTRSFVRFGSTKESDKEFAIRGGQLILEGHEMKSFFEPSVTAIIEAIKNQRAEADCNVKNIFLVGGFAASEWLFNCLKTLAGTFGMDLSRPDSQTNKAVAAGAVSFFLDRFVSVRVAKATYGSPCVVAFNPINLEHLARLGQVCKRPSGEEVLPNAFAAILTKGTSLRESEEVANTFDIEAIEERGLNNIMAEITCYRGKENKPRWTDLEPERFSTLCTIYADISKVKPQKFFGHNGWYYRQHFQIVLACGRTEMTAQLSWEENGIEKRGPAKIIYDTDAAVC